MSRNPYSLDDFPSRLNLNFDGAEDYIARQAGFLQINKWPWFYNQTLIYYKGDFFLTFLKFITAERTWR